MNDIFKKAMIANIENPLDRKFEEHHVLIKEIHELVDDLRSKKDTHAIIVKMNQAIALSEEITELISNDVDEIDLTILPSLDYAGWERVNFSTMTWYYIQPDVDQDKRSLKRLSASEWMITDDHSNWVSFGYDQGPEAIDQIENLYQSWLREELEFFHENKPHEIGWDELKGINPEVYKGLIKIGKVLIDADLLDKREVPS